MSVSYQYEWSTKKVDFSKFYIPRPPFHTVAVIDGFGLCVSVNEIGFSRYLGKPETDVWEDLQ